MCPPSVSCQRGFPSQADVANTERVLQEMRGLISSMQQEITAAVEEKRRREEEEREKQKMLLKKEQMKAQTPASAQQSGGKQQKEGWFGSVLLHIFSSFPSLHTLAVVSVLLWNLPVVTDCLPLAFALSKACSMGTGLLAANL